METQTQVETEVYLRPDDIIQEQLNPGLNPEILQNYLRDLKRFEKELKSRGKPVLILVDASHVGIFMDTKTRQAAQSTIDQVDYTRVAIFGANTYIKYIANFIIRAMGRSDKIQLFSSGVAALEWLKAAA